VPPFFVIDGATSAAQLLETEKQIQECVAKLNLSHLDVMVRSSGTKETIEQRGRLRSRRCRPTEIGKTIRSLSKNLSRPDVGRVHWVVQEYIHPTRRGHLSNERRLSQEPRDFVAEFELQGKQPGFMLPIGVRHWRDGDQVLDFDLSCTSKDGLGLKLKRVALWATGLPSRVLFEWVWSGSRAFIVQADLARPTLGVNPAELLPKEIPAVLSTDLRFFRVADSKDFERYGKLRNAKLYTELGYKMPIFYVLDDERVLQRILRGRVPESLDGDLIELTRRPLIIRTDGTEIDAEKREMLPRSEHLRTAEQAREWLLQGFSEDVKKLGIEDASLVLIAHHFIPSVAAAWARAEPGSTVVRIESLWGLPEGLYWHSHDTFEVDTENRFPIRKRLRFKGTFVAPDQSGRWVHYQPCEPFDWGASISRAQWLLEIAETTRRIAELKKHAVTVMWFVDNDPRATSHRLLPWYHTESAVDSPKAAPRRKFTMVSDFKLETTAHWNELKSVVKAGRRVYRIMLEPKDPELVRNPEFARELAEFAAKKNILIELAGGILSHAYHILRRHGAQVECIDLFGADEEEIEYNKLVRDGIPDLIKSRGESAEVVPLSGEALLTALRQKLVEESYEVADAKGEELIGELADVQEVIDGIRDAVGITAEQVDAEQERKRGRRGGFRQGFMLRKTSTPHTLVTRLPEVSSPEFPAYSPLDLGIIQDSSFLPTGKPYRRPDLRMVGYRPEALLTFEAGLSKLGTTLQEAVFDIPTDDNQLRKFRVSVELDRHNSNLWVQVRAKLEPSQISGPTSNEAQMTFDFPTAPTPTGKARKGRTRTSKSRRRRG
jgi:predicted house-cleaning noncanonical NTP pyrophosphatase (MazG superfamily)